MLMLFILQHYYNKGVWEFSSHCGLLKTNLGQKMILY
jgi:hypothetical protein